MKKSTVLSTIIFVACAFLASCSNSGDSSGLDSPTDSTGDNFFPPVITSITPSSEAALIYDTVTFTATAIDSNSSDVTFIWSIGDGVFADTTESFKHTFVEPGNHTIWVKAIDGDGLVSETYFIIIQITAINPTVNLLRMLADTLTVKIGQELTLDAAEDVSGDFVWYIDNSIIDTRTSSSETFSFTEKGTKTISVALYDEDVLIVERDSVVVVITGNYSAPTVVFAEDTVFVDINADFTVDAISTVGSSPIFNYGWETVENDIHTTHLRTLTSSNIFNFATYDEKTIIVFAVDELYLNSEPDTIIVVITPEGAPIFEYVMGDLTTALNSELTLRVTGTDKDGVIAKYIWAVDGTNYLDTTLGLTGSFTYTFTEPKTYDVKVRMIDNAGLLSAVETISITVTPAVPIVKVIDNFSVNINDVFTLTADGEYLDGSITTYLWAVDGVDFADTTVVGELPNISFNTTGEKRVLVKAYGNGGQESQVYTITINVYNPPVAVDDEVTINEDQQLYIYVLENDTNISNGVSSFEIIEDGTSDYSSQGGIVSIYYNGSRIIFTPAEDYNGVETFTYVVEDEDGLRDTAEVTVTVNPVNDYPVISSKGDITINEDQIIEITKDMFTISDEETATEDLIFSVTSNNSYYSYNGNEVTPTADYSGEMRVYVRISDGDASRTSSIDVQVREINDAPDVSSKGSITANENMSFPIEKDMFDISDETATDVLELTILDGNNYTTNNNNIVTPATNYNGTMTVNVRISDGVLYTNTTITVEVNSAPVIADIPDATIPSGTVHSITLGLTDAEGDDISLDFSSSNSNIVYARVGSTNEIICTPSGSTGHTADIIVTATDDSGAESKTTFTVTIL
jgi:hypothetical protein